MQVQVFSAAGCRQCAATTQRLERNGTPFIVHDVNADTKKKNEMLALGYRGLPVVVADKDNHWSGFRPDNIDKLATMTA